MFVESTEAISHLCVLFPTRQEGVVRFEVESTFAMLLHHTLLPERIPPSIPPEGSASGSRPVSPEYPARVVRQWIPPSIPPEESASGSCSVSRQRSPPVAVSRQRSPPVDSGSGSRPVSRQWIPPRRIPPECAGGSRPVSRQSGPPVDPAQYPARVVREVIRQ